MSLQLANLISVILSAFSLIIFFAALRKASQLTAMSRLMAAQVASSANNLQKALAILQAERETCRDESIRLEARLRDSDRVRSEMDRAVDLVKRARLDLQENFVPAAKPVAEPAAPAIQRHAATAFVPQRPAATVDARPAEQPKKLPVFVNRIVRSADVANAVL